LLTGPDAEFHGVVGHDVIVDVGENSFSVVGDVELWNDIHPAPATAAPTVASFSDNSSIRTTSPPPARRARKKPCRAGDLFCTYEAAPKELKKHYLVHHPAYAKENNIPCPKRPCDRCGKVVSRPDFMKRHQRSSACRRGSPRRHRSANRL